MAWGGTLKPTLARQGLCVGLAIAASFANAGTTPDPVARVGARPVSAHALDGAVNEALNARYYHGNVRRDKLLELRREQLQKLIRRELNILGGLGRGLLLPVREAEAKRGEIERSLGKDEYRKSLKALGWSARDHARVLAEGMIGERAYERFVVEPATVDDALVRKTYEADPERWRVPESIKVEHILLRVAPDAAAKTWTAREGEAQQLVQRLKSGESFEQLAARHSGDDYRVKGGDLGWVHRGRLVEPLESAVWGAGSGDVLGPLKGMDGFHIARVGARRPARQMTFDEAVPLLRKELERRRIDEAEDRWYSDLRKQYPVTILDPELRAEEK